MDNPDTQVKLCTHHRMMTNNAKTQHWKLKIWRTRIP